MNEVEKEIVKAVGATGAAFIGGPVAATIAASLGVAVEMFGTLYPRRGVVNYLILMNTFIGW